MKKETMDAIIEAAESIGADLKPRDQYSGRGMGDRVTCAVTGGPMAHVFSSIAQAAGMMGQDAAGFDEFVEDLHGLRLDNMGKGWVIY